MDESQTLQLVKEARHRRGQMVSIYMKQLKRQNSFMVIESWYFGRERDDCRGKRRNVWESQYFIILKEFHFKIIKAESSSAFLKILMSQITCESGSILKNNNNNEQLFIS